MDDFLDELREAQKSNCVFRKLHDGMPPELQVQVLEALESVEGFPTSQIVNSLASRGFKVGRHRLQQCRDRCDCGLVNIGLGKGVPNGS